MTEVLATLTIIFATPGQPLRELRFPMQSLQQCERIRTTQLQDFAAQHGPIHTATCTEQRSL